MLVLTRKEGERILIEDDITIRVVRVFGNKVRIGIEAPRDVIVRRGELVTQWDEGSRRSGWSTYRPVASDNSRLERIREFEIPECDLPDPQVL